MALRFMDGFDLHGSALALPYTVESNVSIEQGGGRFGGDALKLVPEGGRVVLDGFDMTGRVFAGMHHYISTGTEGANHEAIVEFGDNSLQTQGGSKISSGGVVSLTYNGSPLVEVNDAAGNTWDITSSWPKAGKWFHFEIGFDVNASSSNIVVRVDGNEILNVTGDTTAVSAINKVVLGSGDGFEFVKMDDVFVADDSAGQITDFPGMVRIATLRPSGAGDSADFTSDTGDANYQNVDEGYPDFDTSTNTSSTLGNRDLFTHGDISDDIASIKAVQTKVNARTQGSGKDIAPALKPGGASTVYTGTVVRPASSFGWLQEIFETNPDTTQAWTETEVQNLQAGYEQAS